MIINFNIENFYIAKIGKRRLLKIALIYGANASGKTTILKALDFFERFGFKTRRKKNRDIGFPTILI